MRSRRLLSILFAITAAWSQAPSGRWDGTLESGKLKVPFTLQFESADKAAFLNGERRTVSSAGSFENGRLQLTFGKAKLDAKVIDGELRGAYNGQPLTAAPYCTCSLEGSAGPDITGQWEVTPKGWRLQIERKGEDTLVTLTRPEGELGPLNGRHDGLAFQLHYFDGTTAAVLELEERKDGRLDVAWAEPGHPPLKLQAARLKTR